MRWSDCVYVKGQSTVSTSSTEAEFIAAVQAAKIAKYLRSILLELDYEQPGPTILYEDNQAAILMINSSRPTPRSRLIDIQHFAIQEWQANGEIILCHIPVSSTRRTLSPKPSAPRCTSDMFAV